MSANFNQYAKRWREATDDNDYEAFLRWRQENETRGTAAAVPEGQPPALKRAKPEPKPEKKEQAAAAAESIPALEYSSTHTVKLNVPLPTVGCGSIPLSLHARSSADDGPETRLTVFKERRPSEPPSAAGRVDDVYSLVPRRPSMPAPLPAAVKGKEKRRDGDSYLGAYNPDAAAAAAAASDSVNLASIPAQAGGGSSSSSSSSSSTSGDSMRAVIDQMPITLTNGDELTLVHPQIGSVVPLHLIPNRLTHWLCDGRFNPAEERFVSQNEAGEWVPVRPGPNKRWDMGPFDPPMFLSAKFKMPEDRVASLRNELTEAVRATLREVAGPVSDLHKNFADMTKTLADAKAQICRPVQDVRGLVAYMRGVESTYVTLQKLQNSIKMILLSRRRVI